MKKLLIFVFVLLFISSCGVALKNHTPREFPYDVFEGIRLVDGNRVENKDYTPLVNISNAVKTPFDLIENKERFVRHRFYLSVKPRRFTSIRSVSINVNGTNHNMIPYDDSSNEFWYYESPDECSSAYDYSFAVRYRAGWSNRTKVLGNPILKAKVLNHDQVFLHSNMDKPYASIFRPVPGLGFNYVGELPINISKTGSNSNIPTFIEGTNYCRIIKLQNLTKEQVKLDSVFLSDIEVPLFRRPNSIFDITQFELEMDNSVLPLTLNCGDFFYVKVKWSNAPQGNSQTILVDGILSVSSKFLSGAQAGQIAFSTSTPIFATGGVNPP